MFFVDGIEDFMIGWLYHPACLIPNSVVSISFFLWKQ